MKGIVFLGDKKLEIQNFEDPSKLNILQEDEKIQKYIHCRDKIKDYCKTFKLKYF